MPQTRDLSNLEPLTAYLGTEPTDETLSTLLLTQALPVATLLADSPNHPEYSVPTFIHWAKVNTRLRHKPSGTWRGGPDGVRGVVAVYIHIANAFSMYELCPGKIPTSLVRAFDCCDFDRLQAQLVAFGGWLFQSLQETITKLKTTFSARSQVWKQAVVGQYLVRSSKDTGDESLCRDTNGLPRNLNALTRCYDELQDSSPDLTLGEDNTEYRPVRRHLRARAKEIEEELSDRDSTSAEEIDLPDSDELSDSRAEINEKPHETTADPGEYYYQ